MVGADRVRGLSRCGRMHPYNQPMSESLSARPESRFALVAGIAGALVAAVISVKAIFGSANSTAGIGFVFVPFIMAAAMVFAGVWGLALNPATPPGVMERLSNSSNKYTRFNLTYNEATPPAILEKLAQDPDEILARNASQALQRYAKRLKEARRRAPLPSQ